LRANTVSNNFGGFTKIVADSVEKTVSLLVLLQEWRPRRDGSPGRSVDHDPATVYLQRIGATAGIVFLDSFGLQM
jgi:hypothetical protein